MVPLTSSPWTTDPEYIDLLNYVIERTENVESPMPIKLLVREFKQKKTGRVRKIIHSFKHIDTKKKVKMLFALSASVNPDFLKELKRDAFVEVDDQQRITQYKANDGSLELKGDHSLSAKISTAIQESKRKSLFTSYSEKNISVAAVPKEKKEKIMWNLTEFIMAKCKNVDSPLIISRLSEEFVEKFRTSMTSDTARARIKRYRLKIQRKEFVDTRSKVQQLFGLSATVNSDCLQKLRKEALVEVDEKSRIVFYKANDGSLELRGDHSRSAKGKAAFRESKRTFRSLITSYFENNNNSDAVPDTVEEKEIWNLIGFITEKCKDINSPLNISQLTKDFNKHFGIARSSDCIHRRTKKYCHEIQKAEFLDTPTKVQQLFSLGARLDSDCLQKLRKEAFVEVDNRNRITKYKANNGSLTLHGDHSGSAKRKLGWIVRRKNKNRVKKHCSSDGDEDEDSEKENGCSEDSDEYSREEFESEFDSDDENDHRDETEDLTDPSNGAVDFDNETSIRNRSPTEISIADNLELDPPTAMGEDQENDPEITGNSVIMTRSGRLSKRRHLDAEFSYNMASSRSSGASMNADPLSLKPAKQKKIAIEEEQAFISSNQSRCTSRSIRRSSRNPSFSTFSTESEENMENQDAPRPEDNSSDCNGPHVQEIDDYEYNPREDNIPKSSSIDNRLGEPEPLAAEDHNPSIEAQNTNNRGDAVAPEPEPVEEALTPQNNKNSTSQTNGKEVISPEVPIKVENEEPTAVEESTEDVKPVTAHNPKIKFFEAMQSLILFLDTPSLSNLQSKIHQKICKMKGSKEVLQNNELIPALELLVARMINHSVIDISKKMESVCLIQFFCYRKASILNSKMIGVEGLVAKINECIENSQNKSITMEKVANALRATLDIDCF